MTSDKDEVKDTDEAEAEVDVAKVDDAEIDVSTDVVGVAVVVSNVVVVGIAVVVIGEGTAEVDAPGSTTVAGSVVPPKIYNEPRGICPLCKSLYSYDSKAFPLTLGPKYVGGIYTTVVSVATAPAASVTCTNDCVSHGGNTCEGCAISL